MKTRLVVARSVQRRAFRCPPRSVAAAVAISLAFCAAADASDGGASKVTKCPSAARGPNASKSPDLAEQDPSRNSRTWDGISRGVLPPPHYVHGFLGRGRRFDHRLVTGESNERWTSSLNTSSRTRNCRSKWQFKKFCTPASTAMGACADPNFRPNSCRATKAHGASTRGAATNESPRPLLAIQIDLILTRGRDVPPGNSAMLSRGMFSSVQRNPSLQPSPQNSTRRASKAMSFNGHVLARPAILPK